MTKRPQITIKLGSQHDSVIVDGQEFDRSKMDRPTKNTVRRIVVDAWTMTALSPETR